MNYYLIQTFLVSVLWIQVMMLLLHMGFVLKIFGIDRPFKLILLRYMFAIELVPMYVAAFLTDPLPILPVAAFQIAIFLHLAIHTYQTIQVAGLGMEPGIHIPAPFTGEWIGRTYVYYDTTVHVINLCRLVLVSSNFVTWLGVGIGIAFVTTIPWNDIRDDTLLLKAKELKSNNLTPPLLVSDLAKMD